jgi:hypothetical protein
MRLQDDKSVEELAEWNRPGIRKRDGPNITWNEGVRNKTEKRNMKYEKWLD